MPRQPAPRRGADAAALATPARSTTEVHPGRSAALRHQLRADRHPRPCRAGEPSQGSGTGRSGVAHRRPAGRAGTGHHDRRRLRYFATPARKFILADCPGPRAVQPATTSTGSSTADVIVLLVDARNGVASRPGAISRFASLLRVPHVVLVVNKIDLVGLLRGGLQPHRHRLLAPRPQSRRPRQPLHPGLGDPGRQRVTRSHRTPWYDGPTVLGYLEGVDDTPTAVGADFRFPCSTWSARSRPARSVGGERPGGGRRLPRLRREGRVGPGVRRRRDRRPPPVLPYSRRGHRHPRRPAGDGGRRPVGGDSAQRRRRVSRGDILAATDAPPAALRGDLGHGLLAGRRGARRTGTRLVQHGTSITKAIVRSIDAVLDLDPARASSPGGSTARSLALNDIGRVRLALASPLAGRLLSRAPRDRAHSSSSTKPTGGPWERPWPAPPRSPRVCPPTTRNTSCRGSAF